MKTSRILVMRQRNEIIATFRLTTKKPWAIDLRFYSPRKRPIYLVDMAVSPLRQRAGVGRRCLAEADRLAREAGKDTIRLDAYDAPAGAGPFYGKCGYSEVGRATYRGTPLIYFERLL